MSKETGGPAFPTVMIDKPEGGMTLRDYFAAKAMNAFISSPALKSGIGEHDVAASAYKVADAMLEARK